MQITETISGYASWPVWTFHEITKILHLNFGEKKNILINSMLFDRVKHNLKMFLFFFW